MSALTLPTLPPADAWQLLQLRGLQLRRAQAAVAVALAEVAEAQRALDERSDRVNRTRSSRNRLLQDLTGRLAERLPQWSPWAGAWRARLDEQIEREAYALINDERVLEEAQDRLADCRRELARSEHREQLAQDLLREQRRQQQRDTERRQDAALEDRWHGGRTW